MFENENTKYFLNFRCPLSQLLAKLFDKSLVTKIFRWTPDQFLYTAMYDIAKFI